MQQRVETEAHSPHRDCWRVAPALTPCRNGGRPDRAWLAHEGISASVPLPPSGAYGIDWVGIVTPAIITVLLIALTVLLWRATRVRRA